MAKKTLVQLKKLARQKGFKNLSPYQKKRLGNWRPGKPGKRGSGSGINPYFDLATSLLGGGDTGGANSFQSIIDQALGAIGGGITGGQAPAFQPPQLSVPSGGGGGGGFSMGGMGGGFNPMAAADAAYGLPIAQIQKSIADEKTQQQQRLADLGTWYGQAVDTATANALATGGVFDEAQASTQAANEALVAASGGSPEVAAALASWGAMNTASLQGQEAAQTTFDAGMKGALESQRTDAMAREGAISANTLKQMNADLLNLQNQRSASAAQAQSDYSLRLMDQQFAASQAAADRALQAQSLAADVAAQNAQLQMSAQEFGYGQSQDKINNLLSVASLLQSTGQASSPLDALQLASGLQNLDVTSMVAGPQLQQLQLGNQLTNAQIQEILGLTPSAQADAASQTIQDDYTKSQTAINQAQLAEYIKQQTGGGGAVTPFNQLDSNSTNSLAASIATQIGGNTGPKGRLPGINAALRLAVGGMRLAQYGAGDPAVRRLIGQTISNIYGSGQPRKRLNRWVNYNPRQAFRYGLMPEKRLRRILRQQGFKSKGINQIINKLKK